MGSDSSWQERFRQAMLEKRAALQRALRGDLNRHRDDAVSQARPADAMDKAAGDTANSLAAGLAAIESAQLAQIDEALARLNDGTYGRCLDCDKPIPQKRLQMVPFALRCVQCQNIRDTGRSHPR